LFQREGPISAHLFETRRRGADASPKVTEKELIAPVDTLRDILYSLRTEAIPEREALCLLEFRYVKLERNSVQTLVKQPIVSAMQGDEMIVDRTCQIDLSVKMLILLGVIEFKNVCLHSTLTDSLRRNFGRQIPKNNITSLTKARSKRKIFLPSAARLSSNN